MGHESFAGRQFVAPGEQRQFDGDTYQFQGWHLSNQQHFSPDPGHRHWENAADASPGGVYATHDPKYWDRYRPGQYAHEIWAKTDNVPPQSYEHPQAGWFSLRAHESVTAADHVRVGETHDAGEVMEESVTGRKPDATKTLQNLMAGPNMPRTYKMRAVK